MSPVTFLTSKGPPAPLTGPCLRKMPEYELLRSPTSKVTSDPPCALGVTADPANHSAVGYSDTFGRTISGRTRLPESEEATKEPSRSGKGH